VAPAYQNLCENTLPHAYSCSNNNPEINWEGIPGNAQSLVLIFDDPTAGNYPHWAIYDIPVTETGLNEAISGQYMTNTPPGDAQELDNGFGYNGYLGSCPGGVNTYRWRLYALNTVIGDYSAGGSASSQYAGLATYAENHAIASYEICHMYGPNLY
jgi:hypothetical protein